MEIGGRQTFLDYVFFARPVLLPPVWTIALLGVASIDQTVFPAWRWAILFIQLSCLFGAVYTLNQVFDVESDRANRKLFFLPEGLITISNAWRLTVALDIAALGFAAVFGLVYWLLALAIVVLGIVYSVGPRPWKNRPLAGFLANVIAHGLIVFAMGAVFAGGWETLSWPRSLAYVLAVGGVYLATTVADVSGDSRSGKRTIAVVWGPRATMVIALLMILATVGTAAWRQDRYLLIAAAVSLPFFTGPVIADPVRWAPRAAKAGVAALALAATAHYPLYLALLVVGFVGTRLFFRWRFGLTYPSLR